MTYNFIYEPDYARIIPAVLIDARAFIPIIKNQVGDVIKEYVDSRIELINDTSIVYKIETELGVLAGFFAIEVNTDNKTAGLIMQQFRPAFLQFNSDLSLQIANFINSNEWQQDFLFSNN